MSYYQRAAGDINNAYGQAQNYMQPYQQAGIYGTQQYQNQLGQMSNPGQYYNQLMQGFQQSPAQQYAQQQALNAVSNNSAVSGLLGSSDMAKNLENTAAMDTQQNQQQYYQDVYGTAKDALQGYGNLSSQGMQAGQQMGQWGVQQGQDLASLASQKHQEEMARQAAMYQGFGNMLGGIGQFAGGHVNIPSWNPFGS